LLVLGAWYFLAPTQLGGSFSYFQIVGDSMEPTVARGDLVLLRTAERYEVGDMVSYRDPYLGAVLHRIREVRGDRFILRGDNRDADDSYAPTAEEIIGREWRVVRDAGDTLSALQSPGSAVFLSGTSLMVGALSMGRRMKRTNRTRQARNATGPAGPRPGASLADRSPTGTTLISISGVAFMFALLGAAILLVNGEHETVTRDYAYEHTGQFAYTGVAGTGVYDGDRVATGDPVFTQVTRRVPVSFQYQVSEMSSEMALTGLNGEVRLDAHIRQDNGWKRVIPITGPQQFNGDVAAIDGELDLPAILELTQRMEALSGLTYPAYLLDVIATVELRGDVMGQPFTSVFAATLPFLSSELQLVPSPSFRADVIEPETLTRSVRDTWSLDIPIVGIGLPWGTLRLLVIAMALVAVGSVGIVFGATTLAIRRGEAALIAARYGNYIVDAHNTEVTFAGRRVEVSKVEDLVKIARQDGLFIVHEATEGIDRYHLVLPDVTYTYAITPREVAA